MWVRVKVSVCVVCTWFDERICMHGYMWVLLTVNLFQSFNLRARIAELWRFKAQKVEKSKKKIKIPMKPYCTKRLTVPYDCVFVAFVWAGTCPYPHKSQKDAIIWNTP